MNELLETNKQTNKQNQISELCRLYEQARRQEQGLERRCADAADALRADGRRRSAALRAETERALGQRIEEAVRAAEQLEAGGGNEPPPNGGMSGGGGGGGVVGGGTLGKEYSDANDGDGSTRSDYASVIY